MSGAGGCCFFSAIHAMVALMRHAVAPSAPPVHQARALQSRIMMVGIAPPSMGLFSLPFAKRPASAARGKRRGRQARRRRAGGGGGQGHGRSRRGRRRHRESGDGGRFLADSANTTAGKLAETVSAPRPRQTKSPMRREKSRLPRPTCRCSRMCLSPRRPPTRRKSAAASLGACRTPSPRPSTAARSGRNSEA